MKIENPSAFPHMPAYSDMDDRRLDRPGMMLRDYFAAAAITGLLAANRELDAEEIAVIAYGQADAALEERAKAKT